MQLKLSPRDALIAALVGIVAVAGLVVAFLIVPQFSKVQKLDAEIQQVEGQIQEARLVLERRQGAKEGSAQTQAQLLALANKMPDAPEMPSLIIELQDTANESGLEFVKLAPSLPEADQGFTRIPIDLKATGQWEDIIEYVRRLSRLDRQVRLLTVTIEPGASVVSAGTPPANSNSTLEADIKIEAYTLAATNGAAAPPPAPTQ